MNHRCPPSMLRGGTRPLILVATMAVGLALAACGSTASTPPPPGPVPTQVPIAATALPTVVPNAAPPTAAPAVIPPTAAPAVMPTSTPQAAAQTKLTGQPVPLIVYSAQGYDADVVKAFEAKTGIPTTLVDDSTGPLLAKVQAEANNPQWGVLWVDGDEAFAALDQQGMLLKDYEPNVPWTKEGSSVIPKNKSYIPTGLTMAGTLVYDTQSVSNPPAAWQDLLKPEWKGVVGMNNPAVSGPTFPFVAGMMQFLGGQAQGQQFYEQLKANGLHVYPTNGDTLHALGTGEIKLALIQSSAGVGAGIKTPTIKVAFLPKVSLLPGVIGIDAKAPAQVQTEAKMFAEYVLSPEGQQVMLTGDASGDSLYWPVVTSVQPLPQLPAISSVPAQVLDPYLWGAKEAEINQWFSNTIAQ